MTEQLETPVWTVGQIETEARGAEYVVVYVSAINSEIAILWGGPSLPQRFMVGQRSREDDDPEVWSAAHDDDFSTFDEAMAVLDDTARTDGYRPIYTLKNRHVLAQEFGNYGSFYGAYIAANEMHTDELFAKGPYDYDGVWESNNFTIVKDQ